MSRSFVTVILLLVACLARAEGPPPDPSKGESYDGVAQRSDAVDDALAVPRILLAPVRLLFRGLAVPVRHLLDWDEVNHVHELVFAAVSSRDGLIGVRPAFQYSISFAPVIGLRLFDRKLLGRDTDLEVTAMTGGVRIFYGEVSARPTPINRAFEVTVRAIYNHRDDQVFTGIGYASDSEKALEIPSRYGIDLFDAGARATLIVKPEIFFDFDTMFGMRRYSDGRQIGTEKPISEVYCVRTLTGFCIPGTVDPVEVPGYHTGTQFFRAAADVRFDSRDNWFRPSSGALVELGVDWSHGIGGSDDSQYFRLHGGISAVLDLWKRSRTLVVRFEAWDLVPIGYTPVPFSELIVLGGPDTFRGFRYGRFRNFSSLFAGLEYRWPIWMWMDASLFSEYGGVFGPGFEGFSIERMRPDVGAGVRLRSSDSFFARAQVAYGWGDGLQAFFSVNTGF